MRLTSYTDYALRVLLFVAATDEAVTINVISAAYGISKEHLRKVVHKLAQLGYLHTTQGRNGGIRLGIPAENINIRDLVLQFESTELVECFNADTNSCPILGMCGLKGVLQKAHKSFLDVLGQYHLSDMVKNPRLLIFVKNAAA
ncbi:MAG: Rrf2 family transcriptional regulator [Gammaproteobacteria bacterium]|jgi:Rrf2 family nitric oxide-sensitive transcriptional repressor